MAIASNEPLRSIAERVSISPAALFRHKSHVAEAIVKASEQREENFGESTLRRLESLYGRTEKILDTAEGTGDHRLALQAVREARENLAGIFSLLNKAASSGNSIAKFASNELKAELSRRGEQIEFILTVEHIGGGASDRT